MKISPCKINFKGYDALPLKALHFEETTSDPIRDELQDIAEQENFQIRYSTDCFKWIQDFKTIVESGKQPVVIANDRTSQYFFDEMRYKYRIYGKRRDPVVTGGNSFIGKFPNGEKWMMIGDGELTNKTYSYIAKEYGIKEENIIPIPQQNYHLDMFMRPIGYPFVLVDSPELVEDKYSRMFSKDENCDDEIMKRDFREYESKRSNYFAPQKLAVQILRKRGFVPIEIAGVYGSGVNFLNAIVNRHPDGKISYITNSTECESEFITNLQREFEKDLRAKVPYVDKVYFVKGDEKYVDRMTNYISDNLSYKGGGIHCMAMEEPDFHAWA